MLLPPLPPPPSVVKRRLMFSLSLARALSLENSTSLLNSQKKTAQSNIKRDPEGYVEEFEMQVRIFVFYLLLEKKEKKRHWKFRRSCFFFLLADAKKNGG